MSLTDSKVRSAKPLPGKKDPSKLATYTLRDGRNLFLRVDPDGSKYWIFRYSFAAKQRQMSLGAYPEVSLAAARLEADARRADVRAGRDPQQARELQVAEQVERSENTFASVAAEWQARNTLKPGETNDKKWSPRNARRVAGIVRLCLLPELGALPIDDIKPQLAKVVLLKVQSERGAPTARQAHAACSAIFQHAIASGLTLNNPAWPLKAVLDPRGTPSHYAALAFEQVGPFLRELEHYNCAPSMRAAIRLVMMVAMRDTSLRTLQWQDVDLEGDSPALFSPASRNKGRVAKRRDFHCPLPTQAVALLEQLKPLTCETPESFVFSSYSKTGHLTQGTITHAIKTVGSKLNVIATCHGMRSTLRDWAALNGYSNEVAKAQLAQVNGGTTDAAYLRTDFFEQRAKMLQHYADAIEAAEKNLEPVAPTNVRRLRKVG